jgi:hypothetical protein
MTSLLSVSSVADQWRPRASSIRARALSAEAVRFVYRREDR